jgi:hypothetical protein
MPEIDLEEIEQKHALNNVIASIALEEAALSHILNAEGEKIQAAVAIEDVTVDQLQEVNTSVGGLVNTVSSIECKLQGKLKTTVRTLHPDLIPASATFTVNIEDDNGKPLNCNCLAFALSQIVGNYRDVYTALADGTSVTFSGVLPGEYTLTQEEAPEGHLVSVPHTVDVQSDGTILYDDVDIDCIAPILIDPTEPEAVVGGGKHPANTKAQANQERTDCSGNPPRATTNVIPPAKPNAAARAAERAATRTDAHIARLAADRAARANARATALAEDRANRVAKRAEAHAKTNAAQAAVRAENRAAIKKAYATTARNPKPQPKTAIQARAGCAACAKNRTVPQKAPAVQDKNTSVAVPAAKSPAVSVESPAVQTAPAPSGNLHIRLETINGDSILQSGAIFRLSGTTADGVPYVSTVPAVNGSIAFVHVPAGTYFVVQTIAAEGYFRFASSFKVDVESDATVLFAGENVQEQPPIIVNEPNSEE